MKAFLLFSTLLLVSCGDNLKFTQLEKDIDALFQKNKSDTVLYPANLPDARLRQNSNAGKILNSGRQATLPPNAKLRTELVHFAQQYTGTPYLFASSDPRQGFDCSGYINFVFNHFNFDVPRSSKDFEFFGRTVNIADAKEGDLVLFTGTDEHDPAIGHIGILIDSKGMQSDFVHSSSGKANGVTISSLRQQGYAKRFVKVISVID